jgi:membrane bound O-acyltransferase family protein
LGPPTNLTVCVFIWSAWLAGAIGFSVLMALLAGSSKAGRRLALGLMALGLAAPLAAPALPLLRAILSLYLAWSFINVIELVRDPVARGPRFRVLQVLVLHDLRLDGSLQRRQAPELRLTLLFTAALAGAAAALALYVVARSEELGSASLRWVGRYLAGVLVTYLAVEAVVRLLAFIYRGAGLAPPRLHDHPILSRSLAEFWGRRWNRIVGMWLRSVAFTPLMARGYPRLGIALSFLLSAALHFYFTWPAVGAPLALMMSSFFVLQLPFIGLERVLMLRRWPRALQHLWTLGVLGVLSPLFVEPFLRVVEAPCCMSGGLLSSLLGLV